MKEARLPEECQSIEEVRAEIDALDKQIISLLGRRFSFVKEIVKYKSNKNEIVAQERYDEVIRSRRELAQMNNLSPDVIEQIYRMLIAHFIEEEHKILAGK
jgi:isochorismate pyruvate lyase